MQVEEILNITDIPKRIQALQSQRKTTDKQIDQAKRDIDPNLHAVTDPAKRERRKTVNKKKVDGKDVESLEYKEVNRIPFAYQADIVEKRVSFMLANPLSVTTASQNPNAKKILDAIIKVNKSVKIDSANMDIAYTKFAFYEVAEYWFVTGDEKKDRYGFESEGRIRMMVFKPQDGDKLYPFYDDYGDLVAFSRSFISVDIEGKETQYFETWTNSSYTRYINDGGWKVYKGVNSEDKKSIAKLDQYVKKLGKIPIVYGYQKHTEYYKVQRPCDRNDTVASNHGDINDRHATPILMSKNAKVTEKINDFVQIEGANADLEYIAWDNATQSVEAEFNRNENAIYALSRTPKTSFEQMKGLGSTISGEGLKLLFMDAHLEVFNKMKDFDVYYTRRYNIIKSILASLNPVWKNDISDVEIDIKVTPYMTGDNREQVSTLIELYTNGMISLETACKLNPMFEDAIAEYNRIKSEKEQNESDPKELDKLMDEE